MGKNSAEYMRAYRAKRKTERAQVNGWADRANARIAELEAEVARLTVELGEAKRTATEYATLSNDLRRAPLNVDAVTRTMPLVVGRKTQQTQRDAILRKINRGG